MSHPFNIAISYAGPAEHAASKCEEAKRIIARYNMSARGTREDVRRLFDDIEALKAELRACGFRVSCVAPGTVH
ncbi:hypothetical protein [Bradyrhizobium sp. LeoA1S1]